MRPTSVAGQSAGGSAGLSARAPGALTSVSPAIREARTYDATKRALDIALGVPLLAVALPVITVAGVAILVTTRQNPLLVQCRVGRAGREFPMLKLRTMRRGSGDEPELPAPEGGVFVPKAPDDPRVTPVGRVLRRTSIDELPQLINVLAGQMSLVGPRPALPSEVARYPRSWRRRLSVKPGMTGLWQVSGRSDVPPRRRTALDRLYVRRRSLLLDAAILARTVAATVSMRGAW